MNLSPRQADPSRVLLVEDDRDSAETLARLLGIYGHDVRVAGDGPGAIEVARRERPRRVLLDLGLPGMDGYEVAARLRRELPASTVLIALTGYCAEPNRQRALAGGFDEFFAKPLGPGGLDRLLAALGAGPGDGETAPAAEALPSAE